MLDAASFAKVLQMQLSLVLMLKMKKMRGGVHIPQSRTFRESSPASHFIGDNALPLYQVLRCHTITVGHLYCAESANSLLHGTILRAVNDTMR